MCFSFGEAVAKRLMRFLCCPMRPSSTKAGFSVALALRSGLHGMTGVRFELVARDLIRPFGAPSPEGKGEMI